MKKIFIIAAILLVGLTTWYYVRHPIGQKVIIHNHTIRLILAVTEQEKQKGLGERTSLPTDTGMLFVYDHPDLYGFWMKGMLFPLDFIWINGNTVVDVSKNIPQPARASDTPISLTSKSLADKVLEVNSGIVDEFGIQIGDLVQFSD